MDQRPTLGLIVPALGICCVAGGCLLGPVVIASAGSAILGWMTGNGPVIGLAAVFAGGIAYLAVRRRRAKSRVAPVADREVAHER